MDYTTGYIFLFLKNKYTFDLRINMEIYKEAVRERLRHTGYGEPDEDTVDYFAEIEAIADGCYDEELATSKEKGVV